MKGLLLAILTVAACATTSPQGPNNPGGPPGSTAANPQSDPNDPDAVECKEEKPTGSMMARDVCRSKAERDANRKDAEDMIDKPKNSPTSAH